jgi:hypothetical protein
MTSRSDQGKVVVILDLKKFAIRSFPASRDILKAVGAVKIGRVCLFQFY